jgi:NADPH2:quinone reductase
MYPEAGAPFDAVRVEEIESPKAEAGQVVITVRASSLNFPDVLLAQGKYQFKPSGAFSPGGELSGVVKEVGSGVTALRPGDVVITAMPWGAWREEVVVDAARVTPIPATVDFERAATLLTTYATSLYALKDRGALRAGEKLVVLGAAGGVGLSAVEIGKVLGARVIAAASSDAKLALCREHGADDVIDYSREDLKARIKALTGDGADVIVDPVGGSYSEPAIRSLAWGGRHLVIGFAGNDIPAIPLNLVLLKSCQLVGVFWGQFTIREPALNAANIRQLIVWLEQGKIAPHISRRYRFEEAAQALRDMHERKVLGKVILVPS